MRPILSVRLLTLSMIATGFVLVTSGSAAVAAGSDSLDRFTAIAGGWQLERRCEHLDSGARETFGQIAAHAEIDMARKHGAKKVKQVLDGADQFGEERGADCGDETSQAVNQSYGVAQQYAAERTAAAERRAAAAKRNAATAKRKAQRKREQRRKAAQVRMTAKRQTTTVAVQPVTRKPAKAGPALERFGTQTKAYYLQRRCGHLRYQNDLAFWKLIAHQHHALIRKYGAGAVGRVERRAKAGAYSSALRCGGRTNRMVRAGHQAIRRDVSGN